ncbi:nucleoporin 160 [Lamellibrachia satsuma]|nr:nucleoporin 160 [Lamellibrachia satsuma]
MSLDQRLVVSLPKDTGKVGDGPAILNWLTVLMEPAERSNLEIPNHVDPREAYVAQIFSPGRFSTLAILKACNIYRRCLDTAQLPDAASIPVSALKAEVLTIIEHEIQVAASEYEMAEEEYYQLQLEQWSRFYSCCLQYQEQGTRALGIFVDGITGMVSIVKSNLASFVRICDPMEHIHLTSESHSIPEMLVSMPKFANEPQLCNDMLLLIESIKLIGLCLTDEVPYYFEQDLYHAQCPREVAKSIAMNLVADQSIKEVSLLAELERQVQNIEDVFQVVSILIELLDLGQGQTEVLLPDDASVDAARQLLVGHLFGSMSGVRLLCNSTRQMALARLEIARNLLILLTLMVQLTGQASLQLAGVNIITSELISHVAILVQSYYIIKWCCDTVATPPPANVIDSNVHQLEALDLTDTLPAGSLQKEHLENLSIMELFLRAEGGEKVQYLLSQGDLLEEDPCAVWKNVVMPVVTSICQLIWPGGSSFTLPEFLLYNCQYIHLQDYVRLTKQWCEWNASSRNFMLGQSYLNCGEPYKSLDCFRAATHGLKSEEFLIKLLQTAIVDPKHTEVVYYLKVIRLYEQFRLPDLIVTLAKTAISVAEDNDPNVPTLWSKVFKHQLALGHNEEAYNAMIANPDSSRRKDCLRQFLVVLCERADLQTLIQLPYKDRHVDLEEEVVNILASRARSIDLSKHNYYDLLYAFHVFRGNFRRAGTVMYEYGLRVGQELSNLKGLQQQAKCYLAMLNALRLVDPKYAWIVKPIPSTMQQEEAAMSPKRDIDGNACCPTLRRQVELLELEDIEREYMLVHARLQLLQKEADPAHMTGPTPPADETVGLLVNAGLFDSAVNICKLYKMSFTTVFEGLASRCVSLAASSQDYMPGESAYTAAAWHWLQQNELASANATRDTSAADQAWRLLQSYLSKYEDRTTRYHRCVAVKLLTHNFQLPDWFIASYKKINAPELLSLYLNYDLLEEAALLVIEYIDAVLGNGKEYFGLQTSLHCGAPAVWLPYLYIDQLLAALYEVQSDKFYAQLHDQVNSKLNRYFQTVEEVSDDAVSVAIAAAQTAKATTSVKSVRTNRSSRSSARSSRLNSTGSQ